MVKVLPSLFRAFSAFHSSHKSVCQGLHVSKLLAEDLKLNELKKCVQILSYLRCKKTWCFQDRRAGHGGFARRWKSDDRREDKQELLQAAEAAAAARRASDDCAQLFGATICFGKSDELDSGQMFPNCCHGHSGQGYRSAFGCPAWDFRHRNAPARSCSPQVAGSLGSADWTASSCWSALCYAQDEDELSSLKIWVEGGRFLLSDGSYCQLNPRLLWFDDGGMPRRVIANWASLVAPRDVELDLRLWSARPALCKMAGLALHQACELDAPERAKLEMRSDLFALPGP